jgi:hypothetical protein
MDESKEKTKHGIDELSLPSSFSTPMLRTQVFAAPPQQDGPRLTE